MIVDDDLLVRTMAAMLLEPRNDLHIRGTFSSGPEALAAATDNPPDVMVVDISMPHMSGIELTTQARKRLPETRVLAYTSLADQQSVSAMLRAGASGVVYKEASVGALADAIVTTHSGLAVLSPCFSKTLPVQEPKEQLSATESELLRLVSQGLTNEQIAPKVCLSASTVKYHLSKLSEKLGARNRVALAVTAVRMGLAD
ncbi:response regulator transcription factor [Tessaracoccus caeni]|uniref:response regulator transcription factor n=1 Tax=Tessaracoccus caeni TaxID=3031239 RepID=UPI0023D99B8D|nr:response regulator transcription factor [Tessaracoccus caeni]MDF1486829.1 response regulator transcription factor [Tessaracoccus caeni]